MLHCNSCRCTIWHHTEENKIKYFAHVYRYLFSFQRGNNVSHLHYSLSFYCSKYLPEHRLPENIVATTSAADALAGADFCFHAVPIQVFKCLFEALCVLQGFRPF
jgi:glycerol-3-phosphate dehydrogenase